MAKSLREQIARLRTLSPKLNTVTEEAAKLVAAVEHFLNDECKFGIPAFVATSSSSEADEQRGCESGTRLEYCRIDGNFRLAVSDYFTDPTGETTVSNRVAWSACPRDVKLGTIWLIPALLEYIALRIERTIKDAEEQSNTVREYLRDLGVNPREAM